MHINSMGIDIELTYSEVLDLINVLAFTKQQAEKREAIIYEQANNLKSEIEKELKGDDK